jgi:hypothetical protein
MSSADLAARLNAAAMAGSTVTIVYRDDGRKRTYRVVPIAATNRVLRARDVRSNVVRVFLLGQVAIVEESEDAPASPAPPPGPPGAPDAFAGVVDELRQLGWHVSHSSARLAVHLRQADGEPLSVATVSIARNAGAQDGGRGLSRQLRRPWTVVGPGIAKARSFADLDKAVALFMTSARAHAPSRRKRPPTAR